jgi:hypothetical protein
LQNDVLRVRHGLRSDVGELLAQGGQFQLRIDLVSANCRREFARLYASPADFSSNALATAVDTSSGEEPAPQNTAKNCADCGPLLPGGRSNAPPTRAQSAPHTSLSLARAVSDTGKGCASHVCAGGQLALRIPAFVEGLSARPLT